MANIEFEFDFFNQHFHVENQIIELENDKITETLVALKREDILHEKISGNKFRKLKYNLQEALSRGKTKLLTFGGAYSNHIAAVAATGKLFGLHTIGIIRGTELRSAVHTNPTLHYASSCGMELHFISREEYREKELRESFVRLVGNISETYVIPEGGTNSLAVKGCSEILNEKDADFDYICVSVGTGGTMAGLLNVAHPHQKVIGFSALKGNFQKEIMAQFSTNLNFELTDAYCFGGYAKIDSELIRFMNTFKKHNNIVLDPVYTGKMMFGISDLLSKGYFRKNSRILAIHTGGLQGIEGMNTLLKKKKLPQILY